MGDLIVLSERLADRSRLARDSRPAFFFDLACPISYLVAERIERVLGEAEWIPAAGVALEVDEPCESPDTIRAHAERRAFALRLPLVWPDRFPADSPRAMRAAAHAAELGAGSRFALAASRLAFCGGFDLEDPEILAEAAAAAGVPLDACLAAASDAERDLSLHATAHGLRDRGVRHLPVIRVDRQWFDGEEALGEVAALLRGRAHPLAPAG
jgi:2-hydroxychromene-2-carboxylate isomerase